MNGSLDEGQHLVERSAGWDRLLVGQLRRQVLPKGNLLFDRLNGQFLKLQLQLLVRCLEDGTFEEWLQSRTHFEVGCKESLDGFLQQRRGRATKESWDEHSQCVRIHGVNTVGTDVLPPAFHSFRRPVRRRRQSRFVLSKMPRWPRVGSDGCHECEIPNFDIPRGCHVQR